MLNMTPSKYLKDCKKKFQDTPAGFCDMIIGTMLNSNGGEQVLAIHESIDKKYHDRMNRVFQLVALNILFKNASSEYTMSIKNDILKKNCEYYR